MQGSCCGYRPFVPYVNRSSAGSSPGSFVFSSAELPRHGARCDRRNQAQGAQTVSWLIAAWLIVARVVMVKIKHVGSGNVVRVTPGNPSLPADEFIQRFGPGINPRADVDKPQDFGRYDVTYRKVACGKATLHSALTCPLCETSFKTGLTEVRPSLHRLLVY